MNNILRTAVKMLHFQTDVLLCFSAGYHGYGVQ